MYAVRDDLLRFPRCYHLSHACIVRSCAQSPRESSADDIRRWINDLASTRFAVRQDAVKKLISSKNSRPFVEPLLQSPEADLAEKARIIITEHRKIHSKPQLARFFRYGEKGEIERMVEGLVNWDGPVDSDDLLEGLLQQVIRIRGFSALRVNQKDNQQKVKYYRDPRVYPPAIRLTEAFCRREKPTVALLAISDRFPFYSKITNYSVIVSTDSVCSNSMSNTVILTNDDFVMDKDAAGALDRARNCTIVSAGRIFVTGDCAGSLLVAGKSIDASYCNGIDNSHLISSGEVRVPKLGNSGKVESKVAKPVGLITWFTSKSVGFDARPANGSFLVERVESGSVAEYARLKVCDSITHIGGVPIQTAVQFRKLLLKGSVRDQCNLTVKRDGKSVQIVLDFLAEENRVYLQKNYERKK